MTDLLLDDETWDLDLTNGGELVDGVSAISQHVRQRLSLFLAEWFLNFREGVPWFQRIFDRGADPGFIRSILQRTIEETPGIAQVERVAYEINPSTRRARIGWTAITTDGSRISESDFEPLILGD